MPPRLESEEFIVANRDDPEYAHARNKTTLPPLAAAINPGGELGRDGRRTSTGRRSSRMDPIDRLRGLPEVRPIPWYPGKELPPEKSTQSDRVQTRSACLMASRGRVNDPPCSHCATGLGRFSVCVSLDEYLSGACSTCHLAARGNACSIRLKVASDTRSQGEQQDESQSPQAHPDNHRRSHQSSSQPEPEPESSVEPQNPHHTRRAKEGRQPLPTAATSWTPVEHSNSNLKRKRETLQGTDVWKPYVSPYRPVEMSPRITPTTSRLPSSFTPSNASREELPLLNYIYRKDTAMNGTSQRQDPGRVSSPAHSRPSLDNPWGSTSHNTARAAASNEHANHSARRDASESMSPSEQLLDQQHIHPIEPGESRHTRRSDKSAGSRPPARETALIDSLPRKKQNQIYSLIDGLQSGIGHCQKQTVDMQLQLDTLKSILGIEVEADNGARTS